AELLGQARLTFLAYAGAAAYVDEAVGGEHRESLGISRASGALFRGIALARAGDRERAVNELQRVRALAEPSEDRVVKAARAALANLEDACVELAPELGRYAHAVGERLRGFLATQRLPRRRGPVFVTHLLVAALLAGYVAAQIAGGGGAALLRMGALTPELLAAGSWGRLFTAPFVQVDLIGLLLDVYSVWLGGHVLERIPGRARAALVAIWGAAAGVYAGSLAADSPAEIVAGGSVAAVAVITAALWVLVPARTPGLAAKARRSLAFTLGLLLAAQLLECVPGEHGPGLSPLAVVGAAVVGTILGGLVPLALPRVLQALLASLAFASAAVVGVATFKVAREDVEVFLLAHRDRALEQDGVAFQTPWSFTATAAGDGLDGGLPLYAGLVDSEALRAGSQLQYVVAPKGAAAEPAIFALDPSLRLEAGVRVDDELPPRVAEILSAAPGSWSSALIQRNGELIARVIERTLPDGPRVLLISAPPDAFEVTAELHARILADAAAAPAPDTSR
ncbi:MAG: rhomboid family intramembrane serine protease, partial [Nannocystaceae bacterium]